jgi:hypothetical protein
VSFRAGTAQSERNVRSGAHASEADCLRKIAEIDPRCRKKDECQPEDCLHESCAARCRVSQITLERGSILRILALTAPHCSLPCRYPLSLGTRTSQIVLVVEDEMLPRMLAVDMVEDAGYISIEAVDADEAFAILKSRSDIALLFTDIQIPGSMDGLQLAHSVSKHWPTIKIIIVSGQLKLPGSDMPIDSRFFAKPLDSGKMAAEMQNMIGHA